MGAYIEFETKCIDHPPVSSNESSNSCHTRPCTAATDSTAVHTGRASTGGGAPAAFEPKLLIPNPLCHTYTDFHEQMQH